MYTHGGQRFHGAQCYNYSALPLRRERDSAVCFKPRQLVQHVTFDPYKTRSPNLIIKTRIVNQMQAQRSMAGFGLRANILHAAVNVIIKARVKMI